MQPADLKDLADSMMAMRLSFVVSIPSGDTSLRHIAQNILEVADVIGKSS